MAQNVFQFFADPSLQDTFRDKDTGLPLASGSIHFFKDKDRTPTGLKPAYKLSGTPEDPIYEVLPNPLPLTGIGTTSDGFGNDIKVYLNPFDDAGNPELYYIEVYNSLGVEQFTREGWPMQIPNESNVNFLFNENYIQDGQFLYHLDVSNDGLITNETTNLSYGGWVFLISPGFTSSNVITFGRFPDYVENPTVSPRYYLRTVVTSPNPAELFKDITWVNNNVNFLADKTVTFQFEAVTNNGIETDVQIFYQKIYGDGGSATDTVFLGTVQILPLTWAKYTISFDISNNLGKLIGDNDDDEIRFIVRLPTDVSLDMSFVNFMLVEGQFSVLDYPDASEYDSISKSISSSINGPAHDNSDLGSALILGGRTNTAVGASGVPLAAPIWAPVPPTGMGPLPWPLETAPDGYFLMDGTSYDLVGSNVIPEALRLFNVIGNIYGYGDDGFSSISNVVNKVQYTAFLPGDLAEPASNGIPNLTFMITDGTPTSKEIITVELDLVPGIDPGDWIRLTAITGRNTLYWFRVDGIGTAPIPPSPTDLLKVVDILSSDTADDIAKKLSANSTTQMYLANMAGLYLRGWDNGAGIDPDAALRTDTTGLTVIGDVIGSIQQDALQDHQHPPLSAGSNGFDVVLPGAPGFEGADIANVRNIDAFTGFVNPANARVSTETRGKNMYTNYVIKN